jgi:hypothetical protein
LHSHCAQLDEVLAGSHLWHGTSHSTGSQVSAAALQRWQVLRQLSTQVSTVWQASSPHVWHDEQLPTQSFE